MIFFKKRYRSGNTDRYARRRFKFRSSGKPARAAIPGVLLVILLLAGCSGQEDQREFERDAFRSADGITETDGNGNIIEGRVDPDDWRTAPFFQGLIEVDPAYPNPSITTDDIRIQFIIPTIDANINRITAFVLHEDGSMPDLDSIESSPLPSGWHTLNFPAQRLARFEDARGLHRILLYDGRGNIISYGDLLVE